MTILCVYCTVHCYRRFSPMTREINKQKRVAHAKLWLETGENFHHMLFTDESTISLVRFNTMAFCKKGHLSTKPQPKHPVKIHVWGGISKFGPGPLVLFEGTVLYSCHNLITTPSIFLFNCFNVVRLLSSQVLWTPHFSKSI